MTVLLVAVFTPFSVAAVYQIEAHSNDSLRAMPTLERFETKIEEILDIEYTDTVRVVIASDMPSFNAALGGAFPDWGAAAAIADRKLIVIKSPSSFNVGKSLEELLGHELGHLMLDAASDGRQLPRWFEEGFCQLISGEWRIDSDLRVTLAVWGSGLIHLAALDRVNHFGGAKASLAYAQSYLAVSSLVQEFGLELIPDFLTNYRASGNLYEAFFESTGYRYMEWINLWQKKTVDRYRLVLYIFDPSILFPLIAILFLLLYLIKIYYMRKKKKKWELEERYKSDEQGLST
ncbi:MAG: hypothetical protein GY839_07230 [candidate division Zixibacteria bacterium]|nr:hypothetical protein [candidate division Zixibacteria bacterium]